MLNDISCDECFHDPRTCKLSKSMITTALIVFHVFVFKWLLVDEISYWYILVISLVVSAFSLSALVLATRLPHRFTSLALHSPKNHGDS